MIPRSTADKPLLRDQEIANAYFDLESPIANLRRMSCLLELAAEDTIFRLENELEKDVRAKISLRSMRVIVLSEDQAEAVDYAIRHSGDLIRALYAQYYATLGGKAA